MIIVFKRNDGYLNAGEVYKEIPGGRTCFKLMDGCYMQVDNEKIVAQHDKPICWRCWGTLRVYAQAVKKFFDCPACKYRPNYDEKYRQYVGEIQEL